MPLENELSDLVAKTSTVILRQEALTNGQIAVVTGTADDPDSFDKDGGKVGPLGYYPFDNPNGDTIYIPSLDRVKEDMASLAGAATSADRVAAELAADRAETAATAALFDHLYLTLAAGFAANPDDGDTFAVYGPEPNFATSYQVQAGAPVAIKAFPSAAAVQAISDIIRLGQPTDFAIVFRDENGFMGGGLRIDGSFLTALIDIAGKIAVSAGGAIVTDLLNMMASGHGLRMRDENGFTLFDLNPDDRSHLPDFTTPSGFDSRLGNGGGGTGTTFSAVDIATYDGKALALSARRSAFVDTGYQGPRAKWNLILIYGQSLGAGKEAAPTLTRVPPMADVYMLGGCERPADPGGTGTANPTAWNSVGGVDEFQELIAWLQNNTTGERRTRTQEAAQSYPTGFNGEGPGIGAAYTFRRMWLDHMGVDVDPEHKLVVVNCSVGGQSMANLSEGAPLELFNRIREAFATVQAVAGADEVAHIATLILNGEADSDGGTAKATFKDGWALIRDNIDAEAASAFGQTQPAQVVTYQTSGIPWATNDVAIPQAWREMVAEQRHWSMTAPAYMPPNNPDGHLTGNGSRWLGSMMGKALFEASILGRKVRTTDAIEAVHRGAEALLTFDVPVPPLAFGTYYLGNTAVTPADLAAKGLYAVDGAGALTITAVDIVGQATLRLTFDRDVTGTLTIYGGRKDVAQGALTICDSDPTLSPFAYEYHADYNQPAAENIAALVGKPYPLRNFATAFVLTATPA